MTLSKAFVYTLTNEIQGLEYLKICKGMKPFLFPIHNKKQLACLSDVGMLKGFIFLYLCLKTSDHTILNFKFSWVPTYVHVTLLSHGELISS